MTFGATNNQGSSRPCWNPWKLTSPFQKASEARAPADESLLVSELNALSMKDREKIYEEIHGIADKIIESPDFLREKLREMREHLTEVPAREKKAMDRAFFLRPSLQQDDKLHLMFLRAKRFDAVAAANVMVQHFQNKLALFGDDLLVKKITLENLSEKEMDMVKTGSIQFLYNRESCGRVLFFMTLPLYDCSDWKAFTKYIWYQVYSAVEEDEEIQKRGLVQVLSLHGSFVSSSRELLDFFYHVENYHNNWAFHVNCVHYCYNSNRLNTFLNGLTVFAGKDLRLRQRRHNGSPIEAQYSLLQFGITADDCFVAGQGIMAPEAIAAHIEDRKRKETIHRQTEEVYTRPTARFSLFPNTQDVLLGRGNFYREWPGNVRLAKLVELQGPRYVEAGAKDRIEKTVIALHIVNVIEKEYNGRFLQRTDSGWEVANDSTAKEKVSTALRTEARAVKKGKQKKPAKAAQVHAKNNREGYSSGGNSSDEYMFGN